MYNLHIKLKNGAVIEYLCESLEEGYKVLRKIHDQVSFEFKELRSS